MPARPPIRHRLAGVLVIGLTVPLAASAQRSRPLPPSGRTTPTFACGADAVVPFPVPLSWMAIALAADSRLYSPCRDGVHGEDHREVCDARVLDDAWHSNVPEFRRLAVAAYGRLGRPEYTGLPGAAAPGAEDWRIPSGAPPGAPGVLLLALGDSDDGVRREAANAVGDALSGLAVEPDDGAPREPTPDQIAYACGYLEARLRVERSDAVEAMILETLGRLKYTDDATRDDVETLLVTSATGAPVRVLGAAKGLEALLRANARRPVQLGTRDRLRELAVLGPAEPVPTMAGAGSAEAPGDEATFARVRRLAMSALQTVRDDDLVTLTRAAHDGDWQVRRLAAMRVDPTRSDHAAIYQTLAADRAFQVRYEIVTVEARAAVRDGDCRALLGRVDDSVPTVALHAIDLLPAGCTNADDIVARLGSIAGQIAGNGPLWPLPTHAALALARLSPGSVSPIFDKLVRHPEWPVRAAAATIAGLVHDDATAGRLASTDPHPNVRTAALDALAQMKSPALTRAATSALDSMDPQLLRTAANLLKGTPEGARDDVNLALLGALDRLTRRGDDTSRDARVAILQRLQELLPPEWTSRIAPYAGDVDPRVRDAARTAYETVLQSTNPPPATPLHRYPVQPTADQLRVLPTHARIRIIGIGGGNIDMDLLVNEAPVTVARFVELVGSGYYTGLTFHRVVPNFVIQGGSPGANEYAGAPRFMRDEVGTVPHLRGSVGLSTRGRDTGDGQIFIDLVDLPRLDHDYTVFARVTAGLDIMDRILEGARIESISTTVR